MWFLSVPSFPENYECALSFRLVLLVLLDIALFLIGCISFLFFFFLLSFFQHVFAMAHDG